MSAARCTFIRAGERCILLGIPTAPGGRVLCPTHRAVVTAARIDHERRMTRRASDARIFKPS